jgi:hypothetical protein
MDRERAAEPREELGQRRLRRDDQPDLRFAAGNGVTLLQNTIEKIEYIES